jgi:Uma2 family endonuclease
MMSAARSVKRSRMSSISTALKQTMTADEFLLWAEGKEGRWELHDGVPVMMSPESVLHGRIKAETYVVLRTAIKRAGLPCEVFMDGVAVKIDARTTYEPDASVVCGPRRPDDAIAIDDPIIVVEVLSPNTAAIDHGLKLSGYFSLPSVQHYLILDPERRVVIHHKRGQGEAIETRVLTNGVARLDPPGFEVAVEAMFPPP